MKICPRCQKTYSDDNLNFCLEDGSVLTQASSSQAPPTVFQQVPQTSPQSSPPSQPGAQPQWNTPQQQQYSMQPQKKSSKTWVWVLLILGVLVLVCGGGGIGLVYIASQSNSNGSATTPPPNSSNSVKTPPSNSTKPSNSTTTTSTRDDLKTVDISGWVKEFSVYGTTEYTDGELIVGAKQKGYYYVLAAPDDDEYRTDDADVKVTVRNLNDGTSSMGYGLVFHSNPTPLQQGYAFLINTKTKKYRVVHHTPGDEKVDIAWTASPAINGGTEPNTLEVKDLSDKIELYINGTLVNSIKNTYGYANGVPGLYSGDGIKVAFKDLEIRK